MAAAACGPLPHPFEHDAGAGIAAPGTLAPLAVQPVAGLPGLAEAMVEALGHQDIAATSGPAGPTFLVLRGGLDGNAGPSPRSFLWQLVTPDGRVLGQVRQPVPSAGADGQARLAAGSAASLARLLRGDDPNIAVAVRQPRIVVRPVQVLVQVSGKFDGNSLSRAMTDALARRGLTVGGDEPPSFLVDGTLRISPAKDAQDLIEVEWVVRDAAGKELGTVSQGSPVPHPLLEGDTAPLARQIAGAGADGVQQVIDSSRHD